MFFSNEFLITIHRLDQIDIKDIFDKMKAAPPEKVFSTIIVANDIIYKVAKTYESAINMIYQAFELFEQDVFNRSKKVKMVQSYHLKRRIDIVHRVLMLMKEPVFGLMNSAQGRPRLELKSTKEYLDKLIYQTDVVHDNLVALMSLQLALASQLTNEASRKTNEVMRVLTIFSVFFLPINFIAGLYGMNFEHMPLLKEDYGFWAVITVMGTVTLWIFMWFLKKGFMVSRNGSESTKN